MTMRDPRSLHVATPGPDVRGVSGRAAPDAHPRDALRHIARIAAALAEDRDVPERERARYAWIRDVAERSLGSHR